MSKIYLREIKSNTHLYRDSTSGIAFIEDGSTGLRISIHGNIHSSGSVTGMRKLGYWGRKDRVVRCNGYIYNIDTFICDKNDELEVIVANECMCDACKERRLKEKKFVINSSDGTGMTIDELRKTWNTLHSCYLRIQEINDGTYNDNQPIEFNINTCVELKVWMQGINDIVNKLNKVTR